ncbi:alginate lyase family protein [Alphaproteobacteria bacterium LSUCC0684]
MLRFITLSILFIFIYEAIVLASSYEIRDYGDANCSIKEFNPSQLEIDLTANITGQIFGQYSLDATAFEENMWQAREALSLAAGSCLKENEHSNASCHGIIKAAKNWQQKTYLVAKSPYDSENWWEESFQSNEFFVSFLEALLIADERLDAQLNKDHELAEWLHNALHKNRKYETSKNNHRTVWVVAAVKTALLTDRKVKAGFNKKSAAELINWELNYQFGKMDKDGALPDEAIRGRRAVFYTGRELGYLLSLIEMGENIGLKSYETYADKLHKAVSYMIDAIDDANVIFPYAKKMKSSPKGDPLNQDYGKNDGERWGTFSFLKVYVSRFPEHENSIRIKNHQQLSVFLTKDSKQTKGFGIDIGCLNPNSVDKLYQIETTEPQIQQINSNQIGFEKPKFDRTVSGLKQRFACFFDFAKTNGLTNLPSDEDVSLFITNLEGNKYYRNTGHLKKLGLPDDVVDTNKKALLRLVNFEGTNEEYCNKPMLE